MKYRLIALIVLMIYSTGFALSKADNTESNLPESRQARIKEVVSPQETDVFAIGIAGGPNKTRQSRAVIDAHKSAVYYMLYSGSDPILGSENEKSKFAPREEDFFLTENISKYISYESPDFTQRVEIDKQKKLKIEKIIRVNVGRLREDLVRYGILQETKDIAAEIGYPNVMVLPEATNGKSSMDLLANDQRYKQGAAVIESYLTSRQYEVVVPQHSNMLSSMSEKSTGMAGIEGDQQYKLALSLGSDVFISYSLDVASRRVGDVGVVKASVTVRAYETSTARLLGTETGYSKERADPEPVVIEEAIKDAIDKVLSRINTYWKDDRNLGVQYRLIVNVSGDFDTGQQMRFTNSIANFLSASCKRTKENVISDKTLDFIVWAKPDQYGKSRELSNALTLWLRDAFPSGELLPININRKLIVMELKRAG